MAQGCTVRPPVTRTTHHTRRLTRIVPPIEGLYAPYTHTNCQCNEYIALRERVLGEVPEPTSDGVRMLRAEARRIARRLPTVVPMSEERFVSRYSGKRRTRYANALASLRNNPLDLRKDSHVQAFVKAEKFSPWAKTNPAPRMIQGRNARYNIRLGCFLVPIEQALYTLTSPRGHRLIGKGLNLSQRAGLLERKMREFARPAVVSFDCARFDQHVSLEQLEAEHLVYNTAIPDPELRQLLRAQLRNRGHTQGGWGYKTKGKRMSGDMNTALGNCLVMITMVLAAMRHLGIKNYEILDDGDDCLVIVEEDVERELDQLVPLFLTFGHELKIENRAHCMEDVNWCQTKPCYIDGRWQFVADWRKVMSGAAAGCKYWHEPTSRRDMAFSVGQCLMALYRGVPVLQAYAAALCRSGGRINRDIFDSDTFRKVRLEYCANELGTLKPTDVSDASRLSFERAWGVDVRQQRIIEDQLARWTWDTTVTEAPCEVLPGWQWSYIPGTSPAEEGIDQPHYHGI